MNIKPKEMRPEALSKIRGSLLVRDLLPGVHQDFVALFAHIAALEKINARANDRIVALTKRLGID